ncbi:nucleotide-binding universal stress UspA family protein [Maribacter caenipelagi]|uniref:Nucleotide-binding universal stress UspA family protein n=1 Tax=Maribacter caenipelagi TaxID=1447781 RepID=A0A4R7D768_9FLAO|nr:universal stress protein [Maribacter caenipelagi]TDS16810.1 nucleotide-binding universal stress UspA family protein [Maribacter caenipelagi]
MKKILLPTDFSNNAWNAICYALEFFKNEKCEFHILHTYTPIFYRIDYIIGGPTFSAVPDKGVDIAQAGLDKTLVDIKLKYKNAKHIFKIRSAFNTLTNEVKELTETNIFDFIVMGTQGATGAKEIFLGTNTVHIIRKSTIPVLTVPSGYEFKEIKSIVFPTDYRQSYQKKNLHILYTLTNTLKAQLTILHIKEEYDLNEEQKMNIKVLADHFKKLEPSFVEERGKLMPQAIHEYITENKPDLLVMINRKHSFLERLREKSNVDAIGFHIAIPFITIPNNQQVPDKNRDEKRDSVTA